MQSIFINSNVQLNNQMNSNSSFLQLIKDKDIIINDLNEKIKRFPFILEKNEKLISIIFSSVEQKKNYSIICKNTDSIYKLEGKLFQECPEFFEKKDYSYSCNGKNIDKCETLEKNEIKNGDTIILNYQEKKEN